MTIALVIAKVIMKIRYNIYISFPQYIYIYKTNLESYIGRNNGKMSKPDEILLVVQRSENKIDSRS